MNTDKLREIYRKYNLEEGDYYKHSHYVIITRPGIEKVMAKEKISITYEVITCSPEYAAIKAKGHLVNGNGVVSKAVETFASAKHGKKFQNDKGKWEDSGTTNSWYVLEIAEKRAMSRAVLKLLDLYSEGFFGEDESDEFNEKNSDKTKQKGTSAVEVAISKTKKK
jgi:hypothetical protein